MQITKALTKLSTLGALISIDGVEDGELIGAGGGSVRVRGTNVASAVIGCDAAVTNAVTAEHRLVEEALHGVAEVPISQVPWSLRRWKK